MFKNKFKALVQNKEFSSSSFEILNDRETSKLTGGCRKLSGCGVFSGTCGELVSCQRFDEPTDS
ncbi:hypothetical protein [Flavobacterium sp. 245]|uniref:hypothetical protein n=1 Tax=Flavobacterium sp. 245 TaxID=2512115 RepID=UPI00105BEB8E|nr:hypothetical protein [Flavobacterium sp. 245]TDP02470.1 hypothetical protein EV145_103460 [Flavobacterium sp. 245]